VGDFGWGTSRDDDFFVADTAVGVCRCGDGEDEMATDAIALEGVYGCCVGVYFLLNYLQGGERWICVAVS
jgi:hypothetical protein